MKRLMCIALVVALAALGCGSSGGKKAASTDGTDATDSASTDGAASDERTPKELEADRKIAKGAILKLSDLPDGFTGAPRGSSSADSPEAKAAVQEFADCIGVDKSLIDDDEDETKAEAKSDKFKKAPSLSFDMSADVSPSQADQEKVFNAFKSSKAGPCFETFVNTALKVSFENPAPGETVPKGLTLGDTSVETVDLGLHGKSVVYRATIRATVQGQQFEVISDFVLALKGRIGMTMSFQNVNDAFPEDLEAQIANEAIDGAPDS
jgi:hypothetical protein